MSAAVESPDPDADLEFALAYIERTAKRLRLRVHPDTKRAIHLMRFHLDTVERLLT